MALTRRSFSWRVILLLLVLYFGPVSARLVSPRAEVAAEPASHGSESESSGDSSNSHDESGSAHGSSGSDDSPHGYIPNSDDNGDGSDVSIFFGFRYAAAIIAHWHSRG